MFCEKYMSPLGEMILTSDGESLTGLWISGSKDDRKFKENYVFKQLKIFDETKNWLNIYFSGKIPDFTPKLNIESCTKFQKLVAEIMLTIPYGEVVTYGEIAKRIAKILGKEKMSAQAVGQAVGSNKICIIIPCHRVIGLNFRLTGYGGGIENKIKLLKIEKHNISEFKI